MVELIEAIAAANDRSIRIVDVRERPEPLAGSRKMIKRNWNGCAVSVRRAPGSQGDTAGIALRDLNNGYVLVRLSDGSEAEVHKSKLVKVSASSRTPPTHFPPKYQPA